MYGINNTMEVIEITFQKTIPIKDIVHILEGGLKELSKFTCNVKFDRVEDNENVFFVSTGYGPKAFFMFGMITASIQELYGK